ncbi:MAG TPA: STAS domain-containing protein [bacterium]|nr:STAS domain-containing protein [bacterium]
MQTHEIAEEKDMFIISPVEEIVWKSYPQIENLLVRFVGGDKKILINMSRVNFIDSQGVVFLLRVRRLVEINGGYFAMYGLTENVDNVLTKLQLKRLLNVMSNAEVCFERMAKMGTNNGNIIRVDFDPVESARIPVSA